MANKTTKRQNKSTLYKLSAYARAYTPAAGQPATGFMLSGFKTDSDGNKEYVNIWLDAKWVVGKRKTPDGHFALTIQFAEVEVIDKSKQHEETAPSNEGKKKPDSQSFDDDSDTPF